MSSTFFKLEPQQLQKSRKNSRDVFNFVLSMCGILYFWWAPWSHMWSTSEVNLAWEPCVREARVKLSLWRLHCAAPLSMRRAPWFHRKLLEFLHRKLSDSSFEAAWLLCSCMLGLPRCMNIRSPVVGWTCIPNGGTTVLDHEFEWGIEKFNMNIDLQ